MLFQFLFFWSANQVQPGEDLVEDYNLWKSMYHSHAKKTYYSTLKMAAVQVCLVMSLMFKGILKGVTKAQMV